MHRGPDLTPAFLTRFLQQIRSRRSDFTPLLWLEQWVAEDVMTVEDAAQRSVQELALTQLVMANSIASLRLVTEHRLDGVRRDGERDRGRRLREDPAGTYAAMTRATRDRYRHAVERIAKGTDLDEPSVAAAAVRARARRGDRRATRAHGTWDITSSATAAAPSSARADCAPTPRRACARRFSRHPARSTSARVAIAVGLALAALVTPLHFAPPGDRSFGWLVAAVLLALLPAADAAVAIVHQLVNLFVPASRLPRLDYERAVPEADRTAVVVPSAPRQRRRRRRARSDHIEVQYLANRDPQIRFALLSDFLDSPTRARARATTRSSRRPSSGFAR